MTDQTETLRPLPTPPIPQAPRATPPGPSLPLAKCMVVFLFTAVGETSVPVRTGRIFLQGVANLSTQGAIEQTEKAIMDHHGGQMIGVTVVDWKRLDG